MKSVHKMGQQLKHLNLYQLNEPQSIECPSQDHTPHDQVLDISTCNSSCCSGAEIN